MKSKAPSLFSSDEASLGEILDWMIRPTSIKQLTSTHTHTHQLTTTHRYLKHTTRLLTTQNQEPIVTLRYLQQTRSRYNLTHIHIHIYTHRQTHTLTHAYTCLKSHCFHVFRPCFILINSYTTSN